MKTDVYKLEIDTDDIIDLYRPYLRFGRHVVNENAEIKRQLLPLKKLTRDQLSHLMVMATGKKQNFAINRGINNYVVAHNEIYSLTVGLENSSFVFKLLEHGADATKNLHLIIVYLIKNRFDIYNLRKMI